MIQMLHHQVFTQLVLHLPPGCFISVCSGTRPSPSRVVFRRGEARAHRPRQFVRESVRAMEEVARAQRDVGLVRRVLLQHEVIVDGLGVAPPRVLHLDAEMVRLGCG